MLAPCGYVLINRIKPSLQALAESDRDQWCHNKRQDNECQRRIQCFFNPVQTWTGIATGTPGEARLSLQSCQLRRMADLEIDIDDEGAVNQARIDWEVEGQKVAEAERTNEWNRKTMVCSSIKSLSFGRLTI